MKSLLAVVFLAIGMSGQTTQGCSHENAGLDVAGCNDDQSWTTVAKVPPAT